MKSYGKVLVFILTVVAVFACRSKENQETSQGIDPKTTVAKVGDREITVEDWQKQIDLYRVFSLQPVDPSDPQHLQEVLQSLVDQEVVLQAAKKINYRDPAFDKELKEELSQAEQRLKEIKKKLEEDMKAVQRLENSYKEEYTKMRLAQHFAEAKVQNYIVTEKETRDRYEEYREQAKKAGAKPRAYEELRPLIKLRLQTDKMIKTLGEGITVNIENEAVEKFLAQISPTQQVLNPKKDSAGGKK